MPGEIIILSALTFYSKVHMNDKINELEPQERMNCNWSYVLLGQNAFEQMKKQGATTCEILEYAKLTKAKVRGTLGDFIGTRDY